MRAGHPRETRVRVWPSFAIIVLAVFVTLVPIVVVTVVIMALVPSVRHGGLVSYPPFVISSVLVSQASLFVSARFMPRWFRDLGTAGWSERIAWRTRRFDLSSVFVIGMGALSCGTLVGVLGKRAHIPGSTVDTLDGVVHAASLPELSLLLVAIGVAPALAEEMAFRGLLQSRLVERWGPWRGIFVSALSFGVFHMDLRQGLMAFAMGVWLGYCAHRQRTIVNTVGAHAFNNLVFVFTSRFLPPIDETAWWVAGAALLLFLGCAYLFRQMHQKVDAEPNLSALGTEGC